MISAYLVSLFFFIIVLFINRIVIKDKRRLYAIRTSFHITPDIFNMYGKKPMAKKLNDQSIDLLVMITYKPKSNNADHNIVICNITNDPVRPVRLIRYLHSIAITGGCQSFIAARPVACFY